MYLGNNSQLLKIFDPTQYHALTLKKNALIPDFSETVNAQAAFIYKFTNSNSTNLHMELLNNFSTICHLVVDVLT